MAAELTGRRCGGQLGNQNARKHGFYSITLDPSETLQVMQLTNLKGMDRETAVLRVKLKSVLEHSPDNRRVLMRMAKLLSNWVISKYRLNRTDSARVKRFIRAILTDVPSQQCFRSPDDDSAVLTEMDFYNLSRPHESGDRSL